MTLPNPRLARVASPLLVLLGAASALSAQGAQLNEYGNPKKMAPRATTAAITVADLQTRLYIFADDSMEGRQLGRPGNMRGTDYIASELKKLGVLPGAKDGTYFQTFNFVQRVYTLASRLSVGGEPLAWNTEWVAVPNTTSEGRRFDNVEVVFGGVAGDSTRTITAEQAAGKVVVLLPGAGAAPGGGRGGPGGRGGGGGGATSPFPGAAAIVTVDLDALTPASRELLNNPPAARQGVAGGMINAAGGTGRGAGAAGAAGAGAPGRGAAGAAGAGTGRGAAGAAGTGRGAGGAAGAAGAAGTGRGRGAQAGGPPAGAVAGQPAGGTLTVNVGQMQPQAPAAPIPAIRMTRAAAEKLLGASLQGMMPGTAGKTVSGNLVVVARPTNYARNVIGIIPGSDPKLKGQYVAIGAHNDHVGFGTGTDDHDLARARASARLRCQIEEGKGELVACPVDKVAAISINMDSLRRIHPVVRRDTINNGADDDGSGSMAVLEIAEFFAKSAVKPKRSLIFVWHTGEEAGMDGSRGFTADPSVPIDSIVAALNIDMIGRGRAEDLPGGGPKYLAVLGARVISDDLGDIVDAVNARPAHKLDVDYKFDLPTAWPGYNSLYTRSDHINYANAGIPIAFFFTGLHGDYHQVTDEPQYIDYPHYAKNVNFIKDIFAEVANRADRLRKKP